MEGRSRGSTEERDEHGLPVRHVAEWNTNKTFIDIPIPALTEDPFRSQTAPGRAIRTTVNEDSAEEDEANCSGTCTMSEADTAAEVEETPELESQVRLSKTVKRRVRRTKNRRKRFVAAQGRATKFFVGGLNPKTTSDGLRTYFSALGEVIEAQVVLDHGSKSSRGFGFVVFVGEGPKGLYDTYHPIDNRRCGVKPYEDSKTKSDEKYDPAPFHLGA